MLDDADLLPDEADFPLDEAGWLPDEADLLLDEVDLLLDEVDLVADDVALPWDAAVLLPPDAAVRPDETLLPPVDAAAVRTPVLPWALPGRFEGWLPRMGAEASTARRGSSSGVARPSVSRRRRLRGVWRASSDMLLRLRCAHGPPVGAPRHRR